MPQFLMVCVNNLALSTWILSGRREYLSGARLVGRMEPFGVWLHLACVCASKSDRNHHSNSWWFENQVMLLNSCRIALVICCDRYNLTGGNPNCSALEETSLLDDNVSVPRDFQWKVWWLMRRLTGAFKNVAHNSPAYDAVFRNFSGLGHQSMYLKNDWLIT